MLYRNFWISVAVMMIGVGSVMNTSAQEEVVGPSQPTPMPTPVIQVFQADGVSAWCGFSCQETRHPDGNGSHIQCEQWVPSAPGQVCQAKKICSADAQGETTCSSWWVELDLGGLDITGFTTQQNDQAPIEPADETIYRLMPEAEMSARTRPDRVRQTYRSSPVDLQPYQHIYAADNHFLWLLCEDDTTCDVYRP